MTDKVILNVQDGVARITFQRPEVLNAIDAELSEQFLEAMRNVRDASGIRAVVLAGAGKGFVAGGDIAVFHEDLNGAGYMADRLIGPLHEALDIMVHLPLPVVASLHGPVAGAGVSIALACDLAIAADNVKFALAYARIGATLDGGSSWYLPKVIGLRKAMELSMLCDSVDAAEALRLGLVNRVIPQDQLAFETERLATRLAKGPTHAYGRIKLLLHASICTTLQEQLANEQSTFREIAGTADFREGINAYFEKRAATFVGR